MNSTLSQQQKDNIRQSLLQYGSSIEAEIAKLVALGYEEDNARDLVIAELRAHKREILFRKKVKEDEYNQIEQVASVIVLIISLIGPTFDIRSALWYILAIAIAGLAGYWGHQSRPVAGVLGSIIVPIVFPFAYDFYFSGRTSYIKIEMLIPLLMAIVPALIVYFIIAKAVYPGIENN